MIGSKNMKLKLCNSYGELPLDIKEKLTNANVFFEDVFCCYTNDTFTQVKYIYNDTYIQVVVVHSIRKLFMTASLPTEPFPLSDSGVDFTTQQMFLDDVMEILKKELHVDWLTVTPASTLFQAYPTKSERIKFGNYVLSLVGEDEDVFARITSKHRNMIRRGEKSGVEVRFGGKELLDDYIVVDKQTWNRSGKITDNTEYYKKYLENFKDRSIIGVAYKDNVPQCGILGIYNEAMFYYMFGASANHPEPGATHYLQWRTMQYMRQKKVRCYNFVGCRLNVDAGSKYENIQRFKKGFGGELIECYLFRVTFNYMKQKLFSAMLKARGGAVVQDVIDQEIIKWAEIN